MAYSDKVKQIAYKIDPDCWVSYSGQPKEYKQRMDIRRLASLKKAQSEHHLRSYEQRIAERSGYVPKHSAALYASIAIALTKPGSIKATVLTYSAIDQLIEDFSIGIGEL